MNLEQNGFSSAIGGQKRKFRFSLVIGRMQIPTKAHIECIRKASEIGEFVLLVIGSAGKAPSPHDPLSASEREKMIRGAVGEDLNRRLNVIHMPDSYNNTAWTARVQEAVLRVASELLPDSEKKSLQVQNLDICIIGHSKDATSAYLKKFPWWSGHEVGELANGISATFIREAFYQCPEEALVKYKDMLADGVEDYLRAFSKSNEYRWLASEAEFYRAEREKIKKWMMEVGAKHPPTIQTCEAVVVQAGNVLLLERASRPGKGLLALPGGILRDGMTLRESVLSSLHSQVRIKVPKEAVDSRIVATEDFDYPWRSERGRVLSKGFLIKLIDHNDGLPKLKPSDGVASADWYPLSMMTKPGFSERMFEDHNHVVNTLVSRLRNED